VQGVLSCDTSILEFAFYTLGCAEDINHDLMRPIEIGLSNSRQACDMLHVQPVFKLVI
jgi:hypothetical protein